MAEQFRTLASSETLRLRSQLLQRLRAYFESDLFVEVHPPVLCSEFVIDRHIDPISLQMPHPDHGELTTWYLQSSPEAAMKRLMASSDLDRIYSIGPVFRAGETGNRHNPEFTMVEWYRCGDDLEHACHFLSQLVNTLLGCGTSTQITFADAFESFTGASLFDSAIVEFVEIARRFNLGVDKSFSDDWDDWVNLIFSEVMQPKLGLVGPQIVTHFPASQAALARISRDDSRTAERFELFYRGVELANGYCELLNASELESRSQQENQLRQHDGKVLLPIPEKLIAAMRSGLPSMSGCALGFDRVVALAINSANIKNAMCFPTELA